ncbi:MAG: hypothetical protein QNJ56_06720 [Gammaproteobacteria bacterium]|nr:hypothetical protein [Gammaproteobacteria bacterium]
MSVPFNIAHTINGRTRIRWAGDDKDKHHVIEIAAQLNEIEAIDAAIAKPITGSIVIQHASKEWLDIQPRLEQIAQIDFSTKPATRNRTGVELLNHSMDHLDTVLRTKNLDLNSLTFMMVLSFAVIQALRGQVMVSSGSLLWMAYNLSTRVRDNERLLESNTQA